jgi:hypothetical protein
MTDDQEFAELWEQMLRRSIEHLIEQDMEPD